MSSVFPHHAYYIEGSLGQFDEYMAELAPFWANKFERFGIDEARALVALTALKQEGQGVYFIGIVSITTEAQQALLKLFEEPQAGVVFVVLVPHGVLLPTVRSRMAEYPKIQITNNKSQTISKFLKSNQKERSDEIAKMLKDDDDTKERVREFIDALERECVKLNFTQRPEGRQALADIAMVRDYLRDRSPSLKMLLEHLALCLPKK